MQDTAHYPTPREEYAIFHNFHYRDGGAALMHSIANALLRPIYTKPVNKPILLVTPRREIIPAFFDARNPSDPFPWRLLDPGTPDGINGYRIDEPFLGWLPLTASLLTLESGGQA